MGVTRLLIANLGEIASRITRTAAEPGIHTVAIHSEDDGHSLHVRKNGAGRVLRGFGAHACLDLEQIVAIAKRSGCDVIHSGYGFPSGNARFARRPRSNARQRSGPALISSKRVHYV